MRVSRDLQARLPMNKGKTLFAQVMEFLPWISFTRIVQRYHAIILLVQISEAFF